VNSKSVFILGAGFSHDAQIPLQSQLLKEIINYSPSLEEADISKSQYNVKDFLTNLFGSTKGVTLEDIFTILDRCVIAKERFKSYTWKDIYEIRSSLVSLILYILHKKQEVIPSDVENSYLTFSQKIIEKRRKDGKMKDPVSIISSNWDIVAELFINKALTSKQREDTKIDNCTFTHGKGIPHINLKSLGFFNIKILKLHGSLNWLNCSNCGRLFVEDEAIGVQMKECEFCNSGSSSDNYNLLLEPLIITPTLLKELTNLHIKNVWQNAFIELQEASSIYFIGYSLPYADFEFKYTLKKAIRMDATINVVLSSEDRRNGTKRRYDDFFGKNINFCFDGFRDWIQTIDSF